MVSRKPNILIGAGVAGAALGQVLKARNIPAVLYESMAPRYKQGASFDLSKCSYGPLSDRLGTKSADLRAAISVDSILFLEDVDMSPTI